MNADRRPVMLAALAAALLPLLAAGCGKPKAEPKAKLPAYAVHTTVTSTDLGVPFYPNGRQVLGAGRSSIKDGSGSLSAVLDTADSVETAYAWYRGQLGSPLHTDILNADGTEPQAKLVKADGDDRVEVSISQWAGQTRIILTRHEAPRPESTKGDETDKKGS